MKARVAATAFGSVCAVILAVIGFFRDLMRRRDDGRKELKQRIDDMQDALNLALEEGRITDAQRLQRELSALWERYRRVVAVAAASLLLCGCITRGRHDGYIVIGERINIVEPGQQLVVPDLVPPAKKWYLVDNVGLAGWLGIETK